LLRAAEADEMTHRVHLQISFSQSKTRSGEKQNKTKQKIEELKKKTWF
jgi:hypothetical protein